MAASSSPQHLEAGAIYVIDLETEENQSGETFISYLLDELIMLRGNQERL